MSWVWPTNVHLQKIESVDFVDFNINNSLLRAIEEVGYVSATPIQEKAFPVIMSGKDMVGIAHS